MVLRQSEPLSNMASEQPVKKKLRRTEDDQPLNDSPADETDFITSLENTADLSNIHMGMASLASTINEADLSLNTSKDSEDDVSWINNQLNCRSSADHGQPLIDNRTQIITLYPSGVPLLNQHHPLSNHDRLASSSLDANTPSPPPATTSSLHDDFDMFQMYLIRQCLCGVSEATLRKPFEVQQVTDANGAPRTAMLIEWPVPKILEFLSQLQLLFDVYLKQNNRGYICSRIVDVCDTIVRNEYNLIEQILALCCASSDRYVNYLCAKVLSSFLIIAKTNVNNEWLESIMVHLKADTVDHTRMNFSLEVVKRVVEWKDIDIHVLEDNGVQENSANVSTCNMVPFSDPDSYDTSAIKGLIIKALEAAWPELTNKIQILISQGDASVEAQTCVITFLELWESTISIRANLSVIDTKPFYAHLELFVALLHGSGLPAIVWKQLLSLFNEVLCYGSTLALQDMLPEDTCQLAHLVVRYVKDFRLLDSLPYRRGDGYIVNSFVGTITNASTTTPSHSSSASIDRTLLQKIVLLVLKSVAITIKETRSDSSDSSIGSDDFDFYQDMQLIERSIRDVLKKVDAFLKNSLEFHPETPFSKILVHLFSDQDDYMVESMVCTLDITIGISYRNAIFPDLIAMLNPISSFVEFLKIVSHDADVLLDYLVSNETCFLLYLLRFLKYIRRNWSKFVSSCADSSASSRQNELDNTMTVLIRLKMQISRLVAKELFPYNISPVLRLLEVCEGLYEGNEFS